MYQEHEGDIWELKGPDAVVITTNGFTRSDGSAVMGRGCAKEAADKYVWLPNMLGTRIHTFGNIPFIFHRDFYPPPLNRPLITLPVKRHWREPADVNLIHRGLPKLIAIVEGLGLSTVAMPRPGCGNGQLDWEEVAPEIRGFLQSSPTTFIVCHKEDV